MTADANLALMPAFWHALLARADAPKVELAFLEFMSPTLPEAIAALVQGGVCKVAVVPVFLAQGGHLKRDLPATIAHIEGLGCEKAVVLPLSQLVLDEPPALAGEVPGGAMGPIVWLEPVEDETLRARLWQRIVSGDRPNRF